MVYWSAHGKTFWEIGCILDLSPATVGFYMRRICAKLGAVNKAQAITLAIGQRLIDPFDDEVPLELEAVAAQEGQPVQNM